MVLEVSAARSLAATSEEIRRTKAKTRPRKTIAFEPIFLQLFTFDDICFNLDEECLWIGFSIYRQIK